MAMAPAEPKELLAKLGLWEETAADRARAQLAEPQVLEITYERDLTEADLAILDQKADTSAPVRSLVRIHASHHALARCIATGVRGYQAALITGYSPNRISSLQRDPAFSALVADYKQEARSVFADFTERLNDLSLDAVEILHERLLEAPENFTVPMLLDVIKTGADRSGHGPGSEVHLKLDQDLIDRPPRETFEEWQARRNQELLPSPEGEQKKPN